MSEDTPEPPPRTPPCPRSAPPRLLREALAFARDALTSPSESFRGEVQDVLARILGEDADVNFDALDDGAAALDRAGCPREEG